MEPEIGYGDFEIDMTAVNISNSAMLSGLADIIGANAALSIARNTTTMCKNVTVASTDCGRDGCQSLELHQFDVCNMPSSFLVQVFIGDYNYGADAQTWISFSFNNPSNGNLLQIACQAASGIADAAMAALTVFAIFLGPGGDAAAVGVEAGVDAGTIAANVARGAEAVKFGCDSIEKFQKAASSASNLLSATAQSNQILGLTQSLLSANQT